MAFLVLAGPAPSRHPLAGTTLIGRAPECEVVLQDTSVSRRHARVEPAAEGWLVTDEGSRFGTCVNGARIAGATRLSHGDELRIGNVVLRFEDGAAVEATDPGRRAAGARAPPPAAATAPEVAALERRVAELTRDVRRTQALLALHETFVRSSSPTMIAGAAGPDLLRAIGAERGIVLLLEGEHLVPRFQHGLEQVPQENFPAVVQAFRTVERVVDGGAAGPRGAVVAVPLLASGAGAQGVLYAELPRGRTPAPQDLELVEALCAQTGGAIANLRLAERARQEGEVRANLARYVSDRVAQAILSGSLSPKLGGERRVVSVLFVDIRGFTTLSEKLPPEFVLRMLNEYFAALVPVVKAAHGTVDKFIGDALLAVFGAPNDLPDHALRAVHAALELRAAARSLRAAWANRPWALAFDVSSFSVGIGVNSGPCVAGNLGTDDRREYAVIGDTINVASRLCGSARDQILVGALTAQGVGGEIRLGPPMRIKVKGRAQEVDAFEVLD